MDSSSNQRDREGDDSESALQKQEWARMQDVLKSRLVVQDDFEWSLPCASSNSDQGDARGKLKYVGGVDISFLKEDPLTACAAMVVLDADTLEIVHEEFDLVRMQVPYIPGFLAFREVLQHICRARDEFGIVNANLAIVQHKRGSHSFRGLGEDEDQCSSFLPPGKNFLHGGCHRVDPSSVFSDCDNWCKSPGGYPKGGRCVPPLYQFCCCIQ